MNCPKISILIANYNNGHFFKDCYDSLIAQTELNWEAIVIDDCSTDNSVEIIKNLIKEDVRFKFYVNEKNIGYQKTLIRGIELSKSPIFARLDPDDALTCDALEESINAFNQNPKIGLVFSNYFICDENLNPIDVHYGKKVSFNNDFFNLDWSIGHFACFKNSIYKKTTGIDENNKRAEDQDIYLKMVEIAPSFHINKTLYKYRRHLGGVSSFANSEKSFFWHWVAIIKAAERRNINIENLFYENFYLNKNNKPEILINKLNKSKWIKLGKFLGLLKNSEL